MLENAHRQAALDIEQALSDMGDPAAEPYLGRSIIELYWGAAFRWIACGCQRMHGKHKENHTKLVSYPRDMGEPAISEVWNRLDEVRRGGWYGHQAAFIDVQAAQRYWQDIRTWATS
jgi:hypothetical protein